jgi:hypothetical protein
MSYIPISKDWIKLSKQCKDWLEWSKEQIEDSEDLVTPSAEGIETDGLNNQTIYLLLDLLKYI